MGTPKGQKPSRKPHPGWERSADSWVWRNEDLGLLVQRVYPLKGLIAYEAYAAEEYAGCDTSFIQAMFLAEDHGEEQT